MNTKKLIPILFFAVNATSALACSSADASGANIFDERIFDWQYYIHKNPDLLNAGINNKTAAQQHWLNYGLCEGRQANGSFNTRHYLGSHWDLSAAFGNNYAKAVWHYINYGARENRYGADCPDIPERISIKGNNFGQPNTAVYRNGFGSNTLGSTHYTQDCTKKPNEKNTQYFTFKIKTKGYFQDPYWGSLGYGAGDHISLIGRGNFAPIETFRNGLGINFWSSVANLSIPERGVLGERYSQSILGGDLNRCETYNNNQFVSQSSVSCVTGTMVEPNPQLKLRDNVTYTVGMHIGRNNGYDYIEYLVQDPSGGLASRRWIVAPNSNLITLGSTGFSFVVLCSDGCDNKNFEVDITELRGGWF